MDNCKFINMEKVREIKPADCVIGDGRGEIRGGDNGGMVNTWSAGRG